MKKLLLLATVLLIGCSKQEDTHFIKPDFLPEFKSPVIIDYSKDTRYGKGIHSGDDEYYLKSEGFFNGKTTPEYVKSVKWYVVDNYMGNGCWFITAVHNNHSFHLPNVTLEEYNKYPLNSFIPGDQLFNILNRVNYWK